MQSLIDELTRTGCGAGSGKGQAARGGVRTSSHVNASFKSEEANGLTSRGLGGRRWGGRGRGADVLPHRGLSAANLDGQGTAAARCARVEEQKIKGGPRVDRQEILPA